MTDTTVAQSGSTLTTPEIVKAMLAAGPGVSDLIFSPGRPAQVEKHGELVAVPLPDIPFLRPDDTARLAQDLIGNNEQALRSFKEQGACDLSYSLADVGRFRVNVFKQRGSHAIVMRVIAARIPSLAELNLPSALADVAALQEWNRARHRADRVGQVVHAGGDHRPDQRDAGRAHPHHRGSD
jgi:twitching motility protein PilT